MSKKEIIWEKEQPCLKPGCPSRYYQDGHCDGPCILYNDWLKANPERRKELKVKSIASLVVCYAGKVVEELEERGVKAKYLEQLGDALDEYYEALAKQPANSSKE
jgi:hypothetical protein